MTWTLGRIILASGILLFVMMIVIAFGGSDQD